MSKALVLGLAALASSAASVSAQAVYPGSGYAPYGYAAPAPGAQAVYPSSGYAPYGYSYVPTGPLYDYAASPFGYTYDYTPGMWNRGYWIRQRPY